MKSKILIFSATYNESKNITLLLNYIEDLNLNLDEFDNRILEAGRLLRMEEYLQRKPGHLSGGQIQRVAIGRAIV